MIDVHALASMPYAGMAARKLRRAGHWDEARGLDGTAPRRVTVEISGTYDPDIEHRSFCVVAATRDDAIRQAEAMCDFDDIHDATIVRVSEDAA